MSQIWIGGFVVNDHAIAPEVRPDADYGVRVDWLLRYCVQGTFISDHCWMIFQKFFFPSLFTDRLPREQRRDWVISFVGYEGGGIFTPPPSAGSTCYRCCSNPHNVPSPFPLRLGVLFSACLFFMILFLFVCQGTFVQQL